MTLMLISYRALIRRLHALSSLMVTISELILPLNLRSMHVDREMCILLLLLLFTFLNDHNDFSSL